MWIDDVGATGAGGGPADKASAAICASYAAGVVCCTGPGRTSATRTSRGLFTVAPHAQDIHLGGRTWRARRSRVPKMPLSVTLSAALQARLADIELVVARQARANPVDGHVRGRSAGGRRAAARPDRICRVRSGTSRATERLPAAGAARDGRPAAGRPTDPGVPDRQELGPAHSWYLRLPGLPSAPWAGIVRVECSPDLTTDRVVALANLTQAVLPRFASTEYKDSRAPQNLYPIAGLERELRRRLGDSRLLYRALRVAAAAC